MPGITRQNVINLCKANGIPVKELDFTLTKVYSADEAFVTGTMAGQIPVCLLYLILFEPERPS